MVLDGRLRRRISIVAVLMTLLVAGSLAYAEELERIVAVAKGGATDLALRLLAQHQPSPNDQQRWIRWEKQRLAILAEKQRWDEIAKRVDQLPPNLPKPFIQWAVIQAASAELSAENGVAARRYLRRLIWGEKADSKHFARWRRMVIRSYLIENNITDAHMALLRYKQDYQVSNDAWRLLHAKVLLRARRNKAAFDVLQDTQSREGKILRSLAGLRSGIYKATDVKAEGLKLAETGQREPRSQRECWALVAEAAAKEGDDVYRVIGLERALALSSNPAPNDDIFQLSADDLWQAYEWLAESLGNRMHLLVGDDQAWLKQAQSYESSEELSYARALYAFLIRRGTSSEARYDAHKRLADTLFADGNEYVLHWLYTRSRRFDSLTAIPNAVRYRLADLALKRRDIQFAARLLKGLEDAPAGEDPDQWSLRRARVLIYAGDFKGGALWLSRILDNKRTLTPAFADRYMQVLFDLQAVDRHREAYVLMDSVFSMVDDAQRRREILFWMADSKNAMGEYQEAGELYLRSATYGSAQATDPWGQTARFHAAEALGKAGLVADARDVYRKLLAHTADRRRRALIERNIQQLWLREHQTTPQ